MNDKLDKIREDIATLSPYQNGEEFKDHCAELLRMVEEKNNIYSTQLLQSRIDRTVEELSRQWMESCPNGANPRTDCECCDSALKNIERTEKCLTGKEGE